MTATFQFLDQKRADELQCNICFEQKLFLSSCENKGHIICNVCLDILRKTGQDKLCPVRCDSTQFRPDARGSREVADLDIVCDGCAMPVKFEKWNIHVASCLAFVKDCRVPGCGPLPPDENIQQHMADPVHALKHVELYEARFKNWAATAKRIAEASKAEAEFKTKLGKKRLRPAARGEEEERLAKKSRYLVVPTKRAIGMYQDQSFESVLKRMQKGSAKKIKSDAVRRAVARQFFCLDDSERKPFITKANDMRMRACRAPLNAIGVDASALSPEELEETSMSTLAASLFASAVAEGKECKSAPPITASEAPMPARAAARSARVRAQAPARAASDSDEDDDEQYDEAYAEGDDDEDDGD